MSGVNAQNFADIDDIDELLLMMRTTALTDYVCLYLHDVVRISISI